MAVELHLPDLPDVAIALGRTRPAAAAPWHQRLRDALSAYLPLLMMLLLALGTWYLVKVTPSAPSVTTPMAQRQEPDYTMSKFAVERFDASGRLKLRIEGEHMRHYPATDRIEIDDVHIRAFAPDGRLTVAQAKRALGNGDASELQLLGLAQVDSTGPQGEALEIRSEFLHLFLNTERLRTHLPVSVVRGTSRMQAQGMDYDHLTRAMELKGPLRAVLAPAGKKAKAKS